MRPAQCRNAGSITMGLLPTLLHSTCQSPVLKTRCLIIKAYLDMDHVVTCGALLLMSHQGFNKVVQALSDFHTPPRLHHPLRMESRNSSFPESLKTVPAKHSFLHYGGTSQSVTVPEEVQSPGCSARSGNNMELAHLLKLKSSIEISLSRFIPHGRTNRLWTSSRDGGLRSTGKRR